MRDRFGRKINYLRVSVTDRCNLRCLYCRPEEGFPLDTAIRILSFEEIVQIVSIAVDEGIDKVRLTGGEPLVRRDIVDLVKMVSGVSGVKDLGLTTNGTFLAGLAPALYEAGLHRINVSLDTVDSERFRMLTRRGELEDVLSGIEVARQVGFQPIKLNCVIRNSLDEPDARAVAAYGAARGLDVRFIREMDLVTGRFWQVIGGKGGLCSECNRLRVNSHGVVLPCLFSDLGYDTRVLGPREAIRQAVSAKPQSGLCSTNNRFDSVGG